MRWAEEVARTFTPYVAIAELENTLAINQKAQSPLFLRRNLSYTASQTQTEREELATHNVSVTLEAMSLGRDYHTNITLFVSLCVAVQSSSGGEAFVPIIARVIKVPVPSSGGTTASGSTRGVTVKFPISLPGGVLPTDMVLLVLHDRSGEHQQAVDMTMHARPGGSALGQNIRGITCAISDDRIFYWISTNRPLLFSTVQPVEAMGEGATRRGVIELQPGSASPHVSSRGTSSFSIGLGAVGDATPVFRYSITVNKALLKSLPNRNGAGGSKSAAPSAPSPFANPPRGQQLGGNGSSAGGVRGGGIVKVSYCTIDGSRRAVSKVPSFQCPFDSCGIRCRDFTSLQQHLSASHLYYEYHWVDANNTDGSGSPPEIFLRYKKEWFRRDGTFLPWECSPGVINSHPLVNLLRKSAIWLHFVYHCPRGQRWLRYAMHALTPCDTRDVALEQAALKMYEEEIGATQQEAGRITRAGSEAPSSLDGSEAIPVVQQQQRQQQQRGRGRGRGRGRPPKGLGRDASGLGDGRIREKDTQMRINNNNNGIRGRGRSGSLPAVPRRTVGISLLTPDGRPKFYHARNCMAMSGAELQGGEDSDDETDHEEWMRDCSERLEEKNSLCVEEREFMLAWNLFLHENIIHSDTEMAVTCLNFARKHSGWLIDPSSPFRRCFAAHLSNLWKFRLLTPAQVQQILGVGRKEAAGNGAGAGAEGK